MSTRTVSNEPTAAAVGASDSCHAIASTAAAAVVAPSSAVVKTPPPDVDELVADLESRLTPSQLMKLFDKLHARHALRLSKLPDHSGAEWHLMRFECCGDKTPTSPTSSNKKEGGEEEEGEGEEEEDKSRCAITLHPGLQDGFSCFFCSDIAQVTRIHLFSYLIRVALLVLLWWFLWLSIPSSDQGNKRSLNELGGPLFDMLTCFVFCATVGSAISRFFDMPPLMFVFFLGLFWGNVPSFKFLTGGITDEIVTFVNRVTLTVILCRSGLAARWKMIKPAWPNILAMSVFPLMAEVLVHGFMQSALLDYNNGDGSSRIVNGSEPNETSFNATALAPLGRSNIWPFMASMTSAPSAAAVIGATLLDLRKKGYGNRRGPSIVLVPACVLDFTWGVWGVNFVAELLFSDSSDAGSLAWTVIKGPVQLLVGMLAGGVLGLMWFAAVHVFFAEARRLPHNAYAHDFRRRVSLHAFVLMFLVGGCCVFFGYAYSVAGGGCIACFAFTATAQHLTTMPTMFTASEVEMPQKKKENEDGEEKEEVREVELVPNDPAFFAELNLLYTSLADAFAFLWDEFILYIHFSFAGSNIRIASVFAADFFGRALAGIVVGSLARIAMATICCWSYPMTKAERVISMIGSAGKGTAQAALGGYALSIVKSTRGASVTATELRYGQQVLNSATLMLMLMGSMALVMLSKVYPRFSLTDDEFDRQQKEAEEKEAEEEAAQKRKEKADESSTLQEEMREPKRPGDDDSSSPSPNGTEEGNSAAAAIIPQGQAQ